MPDPETKTQIYKKLREEGEQFEEELKGEFNPFRYIFKTHGYQWGRDFLLIPQSLWGGMRRYFINLKEQARRRDQEHPFPNMTLEDWLEQSDKVCRAPDGILDIAQPGLIFTRPQDVAEWSDSE